MKTKKALSEPEKMLDEIQRIANIGSWEWNISDNTTVWSSELFRIFGVKPEQFDPADYDAFINCIHSLIFIK